MSLEAIVTLESNHVSGVGRARIRLLQAVAREGSIAAGAKAAGLTYKAAGTHWMSWPIFSVVRCWKPELADVPVEAPASLLPACA